MRVVITAIGSRGDVQPLVALACALRQRGHDPLLAAPAEFRGFANAYAIPFRSVGGGLRDFATGQLLPRNWAGGLVSLWHTFNSTLRQVLEETAASTFAAAADADLLVGSGVQFLGPTVAEQRGIPYLHLLAAPVSDRSRYYPPLPIAGLRTVRFTNRLAWSITEAMADASLALPINTVRRQVGLPRVKNVLDHVIFSQSALLAFSPHVCPPAPDWPADHQQVGFLALPPSEDLVPEQVRHYLEESSPPVYVGFGTMTAFRRDALRSLRLILEAARFADVRVLVSGDWGPGIGSDSASPAAIGESAGGRRAFVTGLDLPHDRLFPRVAAVVHHGGAGTFAAGLRAGCPTQVVPHLGDQFYWARRVAELGIGPDPIALRSMTAQRLAASLSSLATSSGYRQAAASLASALAGEESAARAVDFVEQVAA